MAKSITIDVDKAIEIYNEKNEKKITSRSQLIDMLDGKVTLMTFDNWRKGKNIPKTFYVAYDIAATCECELNEFVKIEEYEN